VRLRKLPDIGTRACYNRCCGHPECRAANTAYIAAWRAARRTRTQTPPAPLTLVTDPLRGGEAA
jgi:hypothetical protein